MQKQPSPISPDTQLSELDPNPLPHLIEGVKNLVRTNLKPFFASVVATAFIPAVLILALVIALSFYDNAQQLWDAAKQSIALFAVLGIIIALASVFVGLLLNRIILLGAQAKKTTFTEAAHFSITRLLPTIGTYLIVGLAYVLPAALIGYLTWKVSPLFGLLILLLIVAYLAASFFLTPLCFVLVDSEPLGGIVATMKRLTALWKHGFLVLFVYILCMNFVSGGMGSVGSSLSSIPSIPTGNSSTSEYVQSDDTSDIITSRDGVASKNKGNDGISLERIQFNIARWVIAIIGLVVVFFTIISTAMQSFLLAGLAHAYDAVNSKRNHIKHISVRQYTSA